MRCAASKCGKNAINIKNTNESKWVYFMYEWQERKLLRME